jgi:hypothetical protein
MVQGNDDFDQPILPEPPPFTPSDWANDIYTHITESSNNNDDTKLFQPQVARIVSDDEEYDNTIHYNSIYDDVNFAQTLTHDVIDDIKTNRPTISTILENTIFNLTCNNGNAILTPHDPPDHHLNLQSTISQAIHKDGLYRVRIQHAQNDGGANRSVTSSKSILVHYEDIANYGINGVKEGVTAITCTGRGFIPWRANSGEIILVRCLYCKDASGTILSPSDVNSQYSHRYGGWTMTTDLDSKTGKFSLIARDGINHLHFTSYSENNLWYHYLDQVTEEEYAKLGPMTTAVVNTLSNAANYELWHNRLGHPGQSIMSIIHNHASGIPKLKRNKFYSCSSCISAKFRKQHIGPKKTYCKVATDTKPCEIGQHIHADFGFVRGSDWSKKDNDGKLVTSMDGYRSYCLMIDRGSRYIWIVLTKRKTPPIESSRNLLLQLRAKVKSTYCTITTDLGGELAGSHQFQHMLNEPTVNYTLKTTGAHSSAQNGLAEKPNQDLARMMRAMLYGAGLGSEFWSYALRHAVYLKNRLPHSSLTHMSPFEAINGLQPDLSNLRIFGSHAHFMKGERRQKLDKMDGQGLFMTYKGTDKICYVIDNKTKKE